MEYHEEVAFHEVISIWAKRERMSSDTLFFIRGPLLHALPKDTAWYRVSIQKGDLGSLKVINGDIGWQLVSDYCGDIPRIAQNLHEPESLRELMMSVTRLPQTEMPDGRTVHQYVLDLIESLLQFRIFAWDKGHDLTLILLSSTNCGPYTILEGNHTAIGLYFRYFIDHPEVPYPTHDSYVGISTSMNDCRWYWPN